MSDTKEIIASEENLAEIQKMFPNHGVYSTPKSVVIENTTQVFKIPLGDWISADPEAVVKQRTSKERLEQIKEAKKAKSEAFNVE